MTYYYQTPIMQRILEFIDGSVHIKATDPRPGVEKAFRRYDDIIHAMGDETDLHRSNLDFKRSIFMIDVEYGNRDFPGEIFHNSLNTFRKIEPARLAIQKVLDDNKVNYIETMTGQGYNYTMGVPRDSQSYDDLLNIGSKMRVLPDSAAKMLLEKQSIYENVPLIKDHVVTAAFGRINDYIFDSIRDNSGLLVRTSDLFDDSEILIFDSTQFAYLLHRRAFRTIFSLHQKTKMNSKYGYDGPAIVTLPVKNIPLEERIKIRQDERNYYESAVKLAANSTGIIPNTDMTSLITSYLLSDTAKRHKTYANSLGFRESDFKLDFMEENSMNWDTPWMPDWENLRNLNLSNRFWNLMGDPNDKLLNPLNIRFVLGELKRKGIEDKEIISLIAQKYGEDHAWRDSSEMKKNDPSLRAEYWVRTLKEQL